MSKKFIVPEADSVVELLQMIFAPGVEVSARPDGELSGRHLATFLDDSDQLVALCACDWPFVCFSACALAMIPAGRAEEMIKSGEYSGSVKSNFYEVMNISSKLMMSDHSDHLRLDKTLTPEEAGEFISQMGEAETVNTYELSIPGYGKGEMCIAQKNI